MIYLPNRGTDMEVGGIISANSKKNTVNDRRIEMERDTWNENYKGCHSRLFVRSSYVKGRWEKILSSFSSSFLSVLPTISFLNFNRIQW